MATEPKRKSVKSETLTIRLDPKTRFMLEFVARLRGQTITTVVERAISSAADQASFSDDNHNSYNWRDFWNVSEGVRALKIAHEPMLFPTYEEEKLYKFAMEHAPFFMVRSGISGVFYEPGGPYIDVLWPRISEYFSLWEEARSIDFWGAGKRMAEDLTAAGVKPPTWPPKSPDAPGSGAKKSSSHLDDDIPF